MPKDTLPRPAGSRFRAALAVCGLTAGALSACAPADDDAATRLDTAVAPSPMRAAEDGRCWAAEPRPAVYEQVPGQVQVIQAEIAADGTVLRPPVYRNATVPKLVRPRGETRFEAPCPDALTPDFAASLQRALLARGYYKGAITGMLDTPTRAALRRYQSERGLDSAHISLETAQALGLTALSRAQAVGDDTGPVR